MNSVTISGGDLRLRFTQLLEDSRCPEFVDYRATLSVPER